MSAAESLAISVRMEIIAAERGAANSEVAGIVPAKPIKPVSKRKTPGRKQMTGRPDKKRL
jgi:hypothetical protein